MNKLTDTSLMPFGVHAGLKMANVPATYLLWLHKQPNCPENVKEYVLDNLEILENEVIK